MSKRKICVWFDLCPLKRFYETGILDKKWINNYCWGDYSNCVRKKLEEDGVPHPDNMLPNGTIDKNLR